jgi:hypothetical protein
MHLSGFVRRNPATGVRARKAGHLLNRQNHAGRPWSGSKNDMGENSLTIVA